jgi:predicted alpha/beta hydrolase family esterase
VTRSYLGQVSGPAVLVGHCCGGANNVAAADDRVAGLVYIAAPGPGAGHLLQPQGQVSEDSSFGNLEVTDGRF